MKFKSQVFTQASGSVGGLTYSRNRGGMYTRSRTIPVNPNTERQGEARANMAQAVNAWSNILSDANRQAWVTYANGTPVVDRLGDQLILSGQQMFVKCMLPRLIAGLPIVEQGPLDAGLATTPTWTTGPTLNENEVLAGTVTVADAGVLGDLLIYMSEPTSPSRSLAHAKRAFAGLEGPPVADVFTVGLMAADVPFDYTVGQQCRVTAVYLGDDGRVSAEAFRDIVVEAI